MVPGLSYSAEPERFFILNRNKLLYSFGAKKLKIINNNIIIMSKYILPPPLGSGRISGNPKRKFKGKIAIGLKFQGG